MVKQVDKMSTATKKQLLNKLFIGTDFPWNYKKNDSKSSYKYHVKCMREIFGSHFNETTTTKNFIAILPEHVSDKYLKIYKYA